ncbi:MAG: PA2778 family cysteine peptidase [Gammaproteobacteria bacterium]|nr:PA2778 family cysteine peptidase [Gammaproteobacteria bacterium]
MAEAFNANTTRGDQQGRHGFFLLFALLVLAMLGGCASGPPSYDWPVQSKVEVPTEIEEVPFFPQERYQCGPAALAGVLNWSGVVTTPDELSPYLYIPERQGTLQPELLAQSRRLGRIPYVIPAHPDALLLELEERHPVLVLQNNGLSWYPKWHYAVVVGVEMDEDGDEKVVLRSGDMQRYPLDADTFMNTWRRSNYWGVVVLPPTDLPASVGPASVLRAIDDFARVGEFDAVMTALDAAGERWPRHAGVQFALGNHRYAAGDIAGAEDHYRKGIAADPSAAMLRNNLAWLLAEQGEIEEAREQLAFAKLANDGYEDDIAHTATFVECRAEGLANAECQSRLDSSGE